MTTTLLDPHIHDDATRREFITGLTAVGLLAACGRDDNNGASNEETITVEHAGGTTEVPVNPKRIVTLDGFADRQTLLAFGVDPVLAGVERGVAEGLLAGRLGGVEQIEDREVENLELVAAARPDLILSVEYDVERYDDLSAIAPTVLIDRSGLSVDEHLGLVGRILGRQERVDELIGEFRSRVAAVAEIVAGSRLATIPLAMVEAFVFDGIFGAFGARSFAGRTLVAVGVENIVEPGGQSDGDDFEYGSDLSTERLGVLAPAELVLKYARPATEGAVPIEDQPLWSSLPAVVADSVIEVDSFVWYQDTAISRMARLDDIERITRELA